MAAFFGSFGAESLFGGEKIIRNIYGNSNSPQVANFSF
jgi:hypothetical protein